MQDLAQGKSLAELVKGGWRADEEEVTRIAKELLDILDYLSSRRPAVTHRLALQNHAMQVAGWQLMLKSFLPSRHTMTIRSKITHAAVQVSVWSTANTAKGEPTWLVL